MEARRILEEAEALCRREQDEEGLGHCLAWLGQIARDEGDSALALRHYRDAASIARARGDVLVLAHRLRHIGDIHLDRDEVGEAEPWLVEALQLYRSRDDARILDVANALRPMAIFHEKGGQASAAAAFREEAAALYARAGVKIGPEG